jgi:hypothetical protein
MRFMIIRKADADTEAGVLPTEEQIADMTSYNEQLAQAGVLLDGQGLHPSSNASRVTFRDGTPTVVDGPFAETRELIAGFTIIDVKSREEALEWVRRWPEANVELELRQLYSAEDFGDEFTPELQEREARMREQTGARF